MQLSSFGSRAKFFKYPLKSLCYYLASELTLMGTLSGRAIVRALNEVSDPFLYCFCSLRELGQYQFLFPTSCSTANSNAVKPSSQVWSCWLVTSCTIVRTAISWKSSMWKRKLFSQMLSTEMQNKASITWCSDNSCHSDPIPQSPR